MFNQILYKFHDSWCITKIRAIDCSHLFVLSSLPISRGMEYVPPPDALSFVLLDRENSFTRILFYPEIGPNREYLFTAKISGYTVFNDTMLKQ